MTKYSISVVVAAGPKRKKELFRCISSVKNSNYKNVEIIVVDNSCNPTLSKEVSSKFPKIRVIRLPINTGIFGFNVGFANAQGEYILALDDDCTVQANTLQKIHNHFKQWPKTVGIMSLNRFNPLGEYYYPNSTYGFVGGACVFRKELLQKVGYYDSSFFCWVHEDDFALRTLNADYRIRLEKNIVIYHHEKTTNLRKHQIFLNARNKAWLNIKHFSLKFIPFLIARDLVWVFLLPLRKKSLKAWCYGIKGYSQGYLTFWTPLKKRKVVSPKIQKQFLKHYLFSDFL